MIFSLIHIYNQYNPQEVLHACENQNSNRLCLCNALQEGIQ